MTSRAAQGGMLLDAVIESLSYEDNPRRREVEKKRIERDFAECDERLDNIVDENHDRLKESVHTFTKIDAQVTASMKRIHLLKDSLKECKELLHCKRDSLRKLWIESLENKQILKMLDRIEEAKSVPEQLNRFIANKHYLHATELVVNKVAVLSGELSGVEALQEVRRELHSKEKALTGILTDELHRHLYTKASLPKRKPGRSQAAVAAALTNKSAAQPAPPPTTAQSHVLALHQSAKKTHSRSASRSLTMNTGTEASASPTPTQITDTLEEEIVEDVMCRDPEENSSHFMAILVESLSKLGTVTECIEAIKTRMNGEMRAIVELLSEQVGKSAERRGESLFPQSSTPGQSKLLLELLQLCFEKFRAVGQAHKTLLCHFKRANQAYNTVTTVKLYPEAQVWSAIQYALQLLLAEYFDLHNVPRGQKKATTFNDHSGVSAYYDVSGGRRRHGQGTSDRKTLFTFERSSVAMNVSTYMREKQQVDEVVPTLAMQHSHALQAHLCKPQSGNVTVVFNAVLSYVNEIELCLNLKDGKRCSLYEFIEEFVRIHYVDEVQLQLSEKLESATKGNESHKHITDEVVLKKAGSLRPLMHGALTIWDCVTRLRQLRDQLPPYAAVFRRMMCSILSTYYDHCQVMYRRCVRLGDDSSETLLSAYWLLDNSIAEEFRAQPSWKLFEALQEPYRRSTITDGSDMHSSKFDEESQLVLNTAAREADDDTGAMPVLSDSCILGDRDDLKLLAGLQESLEWLSVRIRKDLLPGLGGEEDATDGETQPRSIPELYDSFSELASNITLLLHLELRIQCVHCLLPVARRTNYVCEEERMEVEPAVVQFNRKLSEMEETLSAALDVPKIKYMFDGLGHLIGILMRSATIFIQEINANGIKKLCRTIFSLQQNLTNLTMAREVDLDRSRQYFELLHLNGDELLKIIAEQGPIFSESEYECALRLMSRSHTHFNEKALALCLEKLKEILTEAC
ncbi:exocyst complex component 4-like [Sycon ciliatum]|uniref:exocyst complex component 4-like n=1 Tax=Sycon ciliatum TaxID=27933 RepID=UPI0020AED7D3|eukprot:scpid27479/ scgid6477/ Exocyst complex component 4; Exocyst complex component Sec8